MCQLLFPILADNQDIKINRIFFYYAKKKFAADFS